MMGANNGYMESRAAAVGAVKLQARARGAAATCGVRSPNLTSTCCGRSGEDHQVDNAWSPDPATGSFAPHLRESVPPLHLRRCS